jgi:predicted metal-dependent HD superfamily phosphohydrolase
VNVYILKEMDHSIGAITRLKAAMITPDEMSALTSERPRVTQALWWHELVTASDPARMDAEPRSAQRLRAARAPAFGALPASRGRRAGR